MSNKKFSSSVLILSVLCAFLTGLISGYIISQALVFFTVSKVIPFEANEMMAHFVSEDQGREKVVRKDIIYFSPGNESLWGDTYREIPEGEGVLTGHIFIKDKPAEALEFSMILSPGRKTVKTTVDENGAYTIRMPKGKYFFNGIEIYNKEEDIFDTLLVNKLIKQEGLNILFDADSSRSMQAEYLELEKELGPEGAAKKMLENMIDSSPLSDKLSFVVGEKPLKFPDFIYRSPIVTLTPLPNTTLPLDKLKFIWEPINTADYYKVAITKIKKKGTTTSYHPILSLSHIKGNHVGYDAFLEQISDQGQGDECNQTEALKEKQLYGFKVFAYDSKDRIITASGLDCSDLAVFSVTKKTW